MQNMKTITFDFFFTYSGAGGYQETNQITVVEPAYDRRDVYYQMKGYMADAELALAKRFADMPKPAKPADAVTIDNDTGVVEKKPEDDLLLMEQMRYALGVQGYREFCEYVSAKLTGDRKLAFIGGDDVEAAKRLALQPVHFEAIAEKGGLEALDNVLGTFISFFEPRVSAQKKVAKAGATSGGTPLLPPAASPPARSRSKQPSA